jgi:hypothetical protein
MIATQRRTGTNIAASSPTAAGAKIRAAAHDPFFIRKTMIPILLTFGVILAGWAALILTAGEDNALGDMFPRWTPIALLALAAIFVLLAVFNMLALKNDSQQV